MQWYFLEILPLFILVSVILWLGKITNFFSKLVDWMTPLMNILGSPRRSRLLSFSDFSAGITAQQDFTTCSQRVYLTHGSSPWQR